MDIAGSMYATAELLSLRYPMSTSPPSPSCSSASLLLSSPWPISPPSSSSSSSPPSSLQTINEATLLSLSPASCSPSSVRAASSPELGLMPCTTPGAAVIFTTTPSVSSSATALSLVDPVSSPACHASHAMGVVAHAPGKSILCVHEQDQRDLIHFSTSNVQLNHVNGNGNRSRSSNGNNSGSHNSSLSSVIQAGDGRGGSFNAARAHLELNDNAVLTPTSTTDGNLFPTLILTSGTSGTNTGDVIPMTLYASLTSVPTSTSSVIHANNGSILSVEDENANLSNATCILMTQHNPHDDDLHHFNSSRHQSTLHHHNLLTDDENNNGASFTLNGFTTMEQTGSNSTNEQDGLGKHALNGSSLGQTTILMNECFNGSKGHDRDDDMTLTKLSSLDDYGGTHGKLKDILMNGNSHHTLLHSSRSNGDYILRDLESSYNPEGTASRNTSSIDINGQGHHYTHSQDHPTTLIVPKEEDDLDELKLHAGEQSSFNDAINSIYNSSHTHSQPGNPFCSTDVNGDLIMMTDGHELDSVYTASVITSVGGSSSSVMTPSTWSSSDDLNQSHHPTIKLIDEALILKEEDTGFLDDDDLLEAKEEREDGDDDDETGVKGELKCKFCGFVCCSKSSLGIHERRHTGERPFACKYCGRLFNSAQCCKHHERLHTGDKPFQCSYCGKKYAVSTRLKRHERVHTREEPYKCTECNKTFRWFDAFRDHRNTHTGVPLYLCSVCGKTFTSYLKFYYHERGHLMKKERDRDRLAKQRQSMGGTNTNSQQAVRVVKHIPRHIDIIKSLQQNSSSCVISPPQPTLLFSNGNKKAGKAQKKGTKQKKEF